MKELIGKTIKTIIKGQLDHWDQAIIVITTDDEMFLIESGSSSSQGILSIEKIDKIPKDFTVNQ